MSTFLLFEATKVLGICYSRPRTRVQSFTERARRLCLPRLVMRTRCLAAPGPGKALHCWALGLDPYRHPLQWAIFSL